MKTTPNPLPWGTRVAIAESPLPKDTPACVSAHHRAAAYISAISAIVLLISCRLACGIPLAEASLPSGEAARLLKSASESLGRYADGIRDLCVEVEMAPEQSPQFPVKFIISYAATSTLRIRLDGPRGRCPYVLGSTDMLVTDDDVYWSTMDEGLKAASIHRDKSPWRVREGPLHWPAHGPTHGFPLLGLVPAFRKGLIDRRDITRVEPVTLLGRSALVLHGGKRKDFGSRFVANPETRARIAIDRQSGMILSAALVVVGVVSEETVVTEVQTVGGRVFPKSGFTTTPKKIWGRWQFSVGVPKINQGLGKEEARFRPRGKRIVIERSPSPSALSEALERDPNDASALFNFASLSLNDASATEELSERLRKAAALVPESPNVWASLAYVYMNGGDYEEAVSAMKKAAELGYADEEEGSIIPELARTLCGREQELVSFLRGRMSVREGDKRFVSIVLAEAQARAGRIQEACRTLTDAIGEGPPPSAMRELRHLRDAHAIICAYLGAELMRPPGRGLGGLLSRLSSGTAPRAYRRKQLRERIDFAKKLAARDETNPILAQLVADAHAAAWESDEAEKWYGKVIELDRVSPRPFVLAGLDGVDDSLMPQEVLLDTAAGSEYSYIVRVWAARRLARLAYDSGEIEKVAEAARETLPDAGELAPMLAACLSYEALTRGRLGWVPDLVGRGEQDMMEDMTKDNLDRLDEHLRSALAREPDDVGLLYLLGITGITQQVLDLRAFSKELTLSLIRRDEEQLERQRAWQKLVEVCPNNFHYRVCLAECLGDGGLFSEAAEALDAAWEMVGRDPEYLLTGRRTLPELYDSAKMPEKAASLAHLIEEELPHDPRTPGVVGDVYLSLTRYEQAFPWLLKAFTSRDRSEAEWYRDDQKRLVACLAKMEPGRRIEDLLTGLQPWQREIILRKLGMKLFATGGHMMLVTCFYNLGMKNRSTLIFHNAPEAVPVLEGYLEEFSETSPDPGTVYAVLGMSYMLVGELDKARENIAESLDRPFKGLTEFFRDIIKLRARVQGLSECLARKGNGTGTVTGRIVKGDQPLPRALVWLRAIPRQGGKVGPKWQPSKTPLPSRGKDYRVRDDICFITTTDVKGKYTFKNVADGEYDLAIGIPIAPKESQGTTLPLERSPARRTILTITGGSTAVYPDIVYVPRLSVRGYDRTKMISGRDIALQWGWDAPKSFGKIEYTVVLYPTSNPLGVYSIGRERFSSQRPITLIDGEPIASFDPSTRPFPAGRLLPYCEYTIKITAKDQRGHSLTEQVGLLSYPGGEVRLGSGSASSGSRESNAVSAARRIQREFSRKNYRSVIREARQWLKEYPGSVFADDMQTLLALAYFKQGDLEKAKEEFHKVTSIYKNSPGALAVPGLLATLTEEREGGG